VREKRLRRRAATMFCFHVSVGNLRNAEVRDKSSKEEDGCILLP
jgi:hypothetical protein